MTQTLASYFEADRDALAAPLSQALETAGSAARIAAAAGAAYAPFRSKLTDAVGNALRQALEAPLSTMLVPAWNRYRPLRKYKNQAEYSPDEIIDVVLTRHRVRAGVQPRVNVLVNGAKVGEVNFRAELELSVDGVSLTIQGGRITEVGLGRATGRGRLTCEGAVLIERELSEIALPVRIPLGAGLAIA